MKKLNWFFYTFIFLFLFPGTGKYFAKLFHFRKMEKKNKWFMVLPNAKKMSNRKTGKYVYFHSVKNGVIFFISLRIWLHFHEVEKISSLPFISTKCKKKKVIFFSSLHIFLFSIFTKWIIFHQCVIFPRSGKYYIHKCNVIFYLKHL